MLVLVLLRSNNYNYMCFLWYGIHIVLNETLVGLNACLKFLVLTNLLFVA